MQRIRSIFSLICCITITLVMLVVGVMAATTVSLGVSLTVSYEVEVVAKVYVATSNPTSAGDNNYFYSGTGDFPASFPVADNVTPLTISNPTITNAVCDTFGYYTIYVKVVNYSAIPIAVNITMTKSDGTASTHFSLVQNAGVEKINAKFNQTLYSGIAVVKVKATQTSNETLKFTVNLTKSIT